MVNWCIAEVTGWECIIQNFIYRTVQRMPVYKTKCTYTSYVLGPLYIMDVFCRKIWVYGD